MKNNLIECPKCIGKGVVYSIFEDNEIQCNLCKGKKEVLEDIADLYDAIADMLSEMEETE